jgi:hypothetical protein
VKSFKFGVGSESSAPVGSPAQERARNRHVVGCNGQKLGKDTLGRPTFG